MVEVSVREGRAVKSQPGKNEDSPELHDVINMVVDDPEEQTLSVRLLDEDGLVKKVRCPRTACLYGTVVDDPKEQTLSVRLLGEDGLMKKVRRSSMHACLFRCACISRERVGAAGQQDDGSSAGRQQCVGELCPGSEG